MQPSHWQLSNMHPSTVFSRKNNSSTTVNTALVEKPETSKPPSPIFRAQSWNQEGRDVSGNEGFVVADLLQLRSPVAGSASENTVSLEAIPNQYPFYYFEEQVFVVSSFLPGAATRILELLKEEQLRRWWQVWWHQEDAELGESSTDYCSAQNWEPLQIAGGFTSYRSSLKNPLCIPDLNVPCQMPVKACWELFCLEIKRLTCILGSAQKTSPFLCFCWVSA